jgi:UDP-2,3-diacylglucosamine pyrophosphatase LpxH
MEPTLAVISDLHVGRNDDFDIFWSDAKFRLFVAFLAYLRQRPSPVELVINGDLIDFLQLRPWDDCSRAAALTKMQEIAGRSSRVFWALGEFLQDSRHRLKVLLGNHDVELAYPEVGAVLRDAILDAAPGARDRFELVDRRVTYNPRVNGLLVHLEHGNSSDPWNAINYTELFRAAELRTDSFDYPPGTRFVYQTMNRFKDQLRFVDVLKPEVPAVPMLLLALRPWQASRAIPEAAVMALRAMGNGLLAALRRRVSGPHLNLASEADLSPEEVLVGQLAGSLIQGAGGQAARPATIAAMAQDLELYLGEEPAEQEAANPTLATHNRMAHRLTTCALQGLHRFGAIPMGAQETSPGTGPDDPFAHAARSALVGEVQVVVFGHTDEALTAEFREGLYVNSGAWADLVRLPADAQRATIEGWLDGIADNSFERTPQPTYVLVEPTGQGASVSLNLWTERGGQLLCQKRLSPSS